MRLRNLGERTLESAAALVSLHPLGRVMWICDLRTMCTLVFYSPYGYISS